MSDFPRTVDEITPEWLTQALRTNGVIGDAQVVSLSSEKVVGGINGAITRLVPVYSRDEDKSPSSIIAKQAAGDDARRKFLDSAGFRAREVGFYRDIAPEFNARTPRSYFADYDPDSGYFILLLEDLGHLRINRIADDTPIADAKTKIEYLARMHASWWESPQLNGMEHLIDYSDPAAFAEFSEKFLKNADSFIALAPEHLSSDFGRVVRQAAPRFTEIYQLLGDQPTTLTHGDFNNGSVIHDDEKNGADSIIPIDWQTAGRSRPGVDLAAMIGFGFTPENRRKHENDLLSLYHSRLTDYGVAGYSMDDLINDFRLGLLFLLGKVSQVVVEALSGEPEAVKRRQETVFSRMQSVLDWNCDEVIPK